MGGRGECVLQQVRAKNMEWTAWSACMQHTVDGLLPHLPARARLRGARCGWKPRDAGVSLCIPRGSRGEERDERGSRVDVFHGPVSRSHFFPTRCCCQRKKSTRLCRSSPASPRSRRLSLRRQLSRVCTTARREARAVWCEEWER